MRKNNIILRLFWATLCIALCSTFAVFSQENNQEEITNNEISKQELMREQIRQERLLWREEMRREKIHYKKSQKEYKKRLKEEKIQETMTKNYAVSFHPLALVLEGGLKFDFSMRLAPKQWLQVAPAIYLFPGVTSSYIKHGFYYYDYDEYYDEYRHKYNIETVRGAGIDINYRYYPSPKRLFYLLGGVNYSYFYTDYQYYDYVPFEEDGLNYYKYMKTSDTQHFNNLKAFACFGIHSPMHKGLFVNGYFGFGYQYSFYNEEKASLDNNIFDYGYRGGYPVLGFSVGYAW